MGGAGTTLGGLSISAGNARCVGSTVAAGDSGGSAVAAPRGVTEGRGVS